MAFFRHYGRDKSQFQFDLLVHELVDFPYGNNDQHKPPGFTCFAACERSSKRFRTGAVPTINGTLRFFEVLSFACTLYKDSDSVTYAKKNFRVSIRPETVQQHYRDARLLRKLYFFKDINLAAFATKGIRHATIEMPLESLLSIKQLTSLTNADSKTLTNSPPTLKLTVRCRWVNDLSKTSSGYARCSSDTVGNRVRSMSISRELSMSYTYGSSRGFSVSRSLAVDTPNEEMGGDDSKGDDNHIALAIMRKNTSSNLTDLANAHVEELLLKPEFIEAVQNLDLSDLVELKQSAGSEDEATLDFLDTLIKKSTESSVARNDSSATTLASESDTGEDHKVISSDLEAKSSVAGHPSQAVAAAATSEWLSQIRVNLQSSPFVSPQANGGQEESKTTQVTSPVPAQESKAKPHTQTTNAHLAQLKQSPAPLINVTAATEEEDDTYDRPLMSISKASIVSDNNEEISLRASPLPSRSTSATQVNTFIKVPKATRGISAPTEKKKKKKKMSSDTGDVKFSGDMVTLPTNNIQFVDYSDLHDLDLLGTQGHFSTTYSAKLGGEDVVVKVPIHKPGADEWNELFSYLDLPPNDNVLPLRGVCRNFQGLKFNAFCLITARQTSLKNELQGLLAAKCTNEENGTRRGWQTLAEVARLEIMMAKGLSHLHSHGFIHRDVALRNFLYDKSEERVLICDFGLSRQVEDNSESYYKINDESQFPVRWMPPEALMTNKFTRFGDIWMLGVSLWELLTGGTVRPFDEHKTSAQVMLNICSGHASLTFPVVQGCEVEAKLCQDLLDACMKSEPDQRPSIDEIVTWLELVRNECLSRLQ